MRPQEIRKWKKKHQNWVERQDSVQSLIQKLVLGNNGQELHKSKDQDFLVLPNLACLFLTLRQMFSHGF